MCLFTVTRRQATWLYAVVLVVIVLLCNLVPAMSDILSLTLIGAVGVGTCVAYCRRPHQTTATTPRVENVPLAAASYPAGDHNESYAAQHQSEADTQSILAMGASSVPSAPPRFAYLDNLRASLTAIVVVHHVLGAFAGGGSVGLSVGNFKNLLQPLLLATQLLNQSYFMALFFFIAGFCSPPSLDRKGPDAFLVDRFKRLGPPILLYAFLIGPGVSALADVIASRNRGYQVSTGPLWFAMWLLIFSAAYACIRGDVGGDHLTASRPSFWTLLGAGAALGAAQATQFMFMPVFPMMPITFGSLPFDVAAFTAGVVARRNGWLDGQVQRGTIIAASVVVAAFTITLVVAFVVITAEGGGAYLLSSNACGTSPDRVGGVTQVIGGGIEGILYGLSMAAGAYCVSISVLLLALFRARFNDDGAWSLFFSRVSFAVYVLHPVVVVPLTAAFIVVVRAVNGDASMRTWTVGSSPIVDSPDCVAMGGVSNSLVLLIGCTTVSFLSVLLTYPLADVTRRLPGMKYVLG